VSLSGENIQVSTIEGVLALPFVVMGPLAVIGGVLIRGRETAAWRIRRDRRLCLTKICAEQWLLTTNKTHHLWRQRIQNKQGHRPANYS